MDIVDEDIVDVILKDSRFAAQQRTLVMMATDIRIRAISRKSNDDGGGGGGECISLTRQSERSLW